MSWTVQCTSTPIDQSIPFSILDLKAQAVRLPVSKGAQILLSELLTWSGERGYCWWGKPAIAKDLNWSVSEVWRRATELKRAGLLEVVPRPGRSNYWVPLPGKNKIERLKNELPPLAESRGPLEKKRELEKKRFTVPSRGTCTEAPPPHQRQNVNAPKVSTPEMSPTVRTTSPLDIAQKSVPAVQASAQPKPISHHPMPSTIIPNPEPRSPLTQDHLILVEEIERVTGDTWSRGHFVNLVRQVDEQTLYAALSVTREKMTLESGVNGGAYFTSTLKGMMGLAGLGETSSRTPITQPLQSPHVPTPPEAQPIPRRSDIVEADPVDPESLKKGWRLHYKGVGLRGMLILVQRCVPLSIDVGRIWDDIRETFYGIEEGSLVDRFLDTVVTRTKHTGRFAETAT